MRRSGKEREGERMRGEGMGEAPTCDESDTEADEEEDL